MARAFEEQGKYYHALGYYKWVVHNYPENIDAYYGLGRTYLAINSYYDAEETYKKILTMKPNDRAALAGIARSHNLSGKHRLAAKEYSDLLTHGYQENEYRREFAYAQYWAGFDELALDTLKNIPGKDAASLRSQILRDLNNPLEIDYDGGTDSDGLDINIAALSAGIRFHQTHLLQGIARVARLYQNNKLIYGKTFLLKWTSRFGGLYSDLGTHWPSIALGARDYDNWQSVAWRIADKWFPNDLLRVDIEAKNEPVENIISIENKILFTSVLGSIDYRIHLRLIITAGARIGRFSDSNIRKDLFGRVMYTVAYEPRINIGAEARYFGDSKTELNNGYYNPDQYSEYKLIAAVSHYFGDWRVKVMGAMGQLDEAPGPNGALYQYEASIGKDFKQYGRFRAYIGHSSSNSSISAPADFKVGYHITYWGIGYSFSF
jgi:tetratricopeptide (TPR) repeat protein